MQGGILARNIIKYCWIEYENDFVTDLLSILQPGS